MKKLTEKEDISLTEKEELLLEEQGIKWRSTHSRKGLKAIVRLNYPGYTEEEEAVYLIAYSQENNKDLIYALFHGFKFGYGKTSLHGLSSFEKDPKFVPIDVIELYKNFKTGRTNSCR